MLRKSFWYRHSVKVLLDLLQGMLAGFLALIIVSFPVWMDGDVSLREVGRGFENTDQFFELVERTIRDKIESELDRELFERDGAYDPDKLIDIRQYQSGVLDEANFNMGLTYRIDDLISFGGQGTQAMLDAVSDFGENTMPDEEKAQKLLEKAEELETVLPVSGVSLKDTASVSANPAANLADLYRLLCETSRDLLQRYDRYLQSAEGEKSAKAPSNIAFYVENTVTRRYYTNLPATSGQAAISAIEDNDALTFLFDGERRFNIMVSNPEHVMSELCSDYFMQTTFLGNGEKVLIAADLSYPVGDEISRSYSRYLQRVPIFYLTIVSISLIVILMIAQLGVSVAVNGRSFRGDVVHLMPFDQVPTEIAAGLCVVSAILWWMLGNRAIAMWRLFPKRYVAAVFFQAAVFYEIAVLALHSLLRRIYGGNFWENSVVYYVVKGARAVYAARKSSRRILMIYVGFIILNLVALVIGGIPGLALALVLDLTALLYLMRDVVGNQNIREGLRQLSKGKLDYRIDTDVLTGESRETGRAVNEMGEGLEKAVESMLASERLKAELITNVSHDLKTPLTSIVNYVDLLKRRDIQDETAKEYLEILDSKTQRLRQLTEDLVEVSKISSGNIELHPGQVELRQFIMQAGGEFEDRLMERDIQIHYALGTQPVNIYVDGARLWRIFENLLGNVYKYGKSGSPMSITLSCEDGEMIGPGQSFISEQSLEKGQTIPEQGSGRGQNTPEKASAVEQAISEKNSGKGQTTPDQDPGKRDELWQGRKAGQIAVMRFHNISGTKITASASQLKERFGRGDESRRTEGFGLGLSIADSLAAAMGGSFDVIVDETDFEAVLKFPVV